MLSENMKIIRHLNTTACVALGYTLAVFHSSIYSCFEYIYVTFPSAFNTFVLRAFQKLHGFVLKYANSFNYLYISVEHFAPLEFPSLPCFSVLFIYLLTSKENEFHKQSM